jgi:hypothetical protein
MRYARGEAQERRKRVVVPLLSLPEARCARARKQRDARTAGRGGGRRCSVGTGAAIVQKTVYAGAGAAGG